ncbi:NPC intracellular cholesterol transporter 1 [Sparganum proliferum]
MRQERDRQRESLALSDPNPDKSVANIFRHRSFSKRGHELQPLLNDNKIFLIVDTDKAKITEIFETAPRMRQERDRQRESLALSDPNPDKSVANIFRHRSFSKRGHELQPLLNDNKIFLIVDTDKANTTNRLIAGGNIPLIAAFMRLTDLVLAWLLPLTLGDQCIWYGVCPTQDSEGTYCARNVSATPLRNRSDGILQTLLELCPDYASPDSSAASVPVCCDADQVKAFSVGIQSASVLLGRCPACFANFRRLFCKMTCDPHQSAFLQPLNVTKTDAVTEVLYVLTTRFAEGFFNNCKSVQFGGMPAINTICEDTECTPSKLLAALGRSTREGGQAPFSINFTIVDESVSPRLTPMNAPVYTCEKAVPPSGMDSGGPACSCSDCEAACTYPTPPKPDEPYTILGFPLPWFVMFLVFVGLLTIFVASELFQTCTAARRRRQQDHSTVNSEVVISTPPSNPSSLGFHARLGPAVEATLSKAFSQLGRGIARHPIATLTLSLIVVASLCCGLTMFTVTTAPIDLWSDPNSLARQEKDYFDTHFGPFYRIEQLIIRPVNESSVVHSNTTFGPAFQKEFLDKVLELQLLLMNVTVTSPKLNRPVSLRDICFRPLLPDIVECAVTSPLEYFQHDATFFNEQNGSATYLDHINFCGRSPLSTTGSPLNDSASCLGSSGLPQMPNVVFGGFKGNFTNASAVVVTFLVNNSADLSSELVTMALDWEKVYLQTIQSWIANNSDQLIVSYQAERSAEDEIERQSNADIRTVIISYLVMFAYVSVFLGVYHNCRTIPVDLKATLGLGGVLVVLASVAASIGIWSYAGVPATLIIIEVIPFLVLAVGVDNIFILVQDYQMDEAASASQKAVTGSQNRPTSEDLHTQIDFDLRSEVEARIARTLGRVGPSMFLCSASESVAFFCGSMTSMPAVRVFALYAGVALVINFLLQLFAFTALLTLDSRRSALRKWDICCCFKLSSEPPSQASASNDRAPLIESVEGSASLECDVPAQEEHTDSSRPEAPRKFHNEGKLIYVFAVCQPRPPLGAAAKFHRPWQDPYIIVYQPFPDTFVLRDPQRPFADVLTVHYNQIKPAPDCGPPPDSPLFLVPSGSLPPVAQTVEISASNSQG